MVVSECSARTPVRATKARTVSAPPTFFRHATTTYTLLDSSTSTMSRPLTPKNEFMLTSSALMPSDIITLPPVAANASTPPATTDATLLPCERRFLIRLADDIEGRSRWTTPEAARDAQAGIRFLPPYHPAARSVQGALQARAAQDVVRRTREAESRRQAEVDRQQQQAQTRPVFVVANAAAGTAQVVGRLASPQAEGENAGEEPAQQPASEGGEKAEDSEEDGIDPDSMPHVDAACARCIDQKRRCNRRRPCQFCLREGIGEEGCILPPRGSDSPEPSSLSLNQQPPVTSSTASVPDNVGETSKTQVKRKRKETTTPPAAPAEQPAQATPAVLVPPTTRARPTQPSSSATSNLNTTNRTGGQRNRARPKKLTSPPPFLGRNFLTDAEQKIQDAYYERHKDD